MSFKDKLVIDIKTYVKESKWEDIVSEQVIDIVEMRPAKVFSYLHEKSAVKNKLDHTSGGKNTGLISDIGFYCAYFDPLLHSRDTFANKIIGCTIQKYQQQKIRRGDVMKIVSIVLLDFDTPEKECLTKPLLSRLSDTIIISQFSSILYQTVLYRGALEELLRLMEQLEEIEQKLTIDLFRSFLQALNEGTSCVKRLKIEPPETINRDLSIAEVLQLLAQSALLAVFGC